jgi:hypothetical protein
VIKGKEKYRRKETEKNKDKKKINIPPLELHSPKRLSQRYPRRLRHGDTVACFNRVKLPTLTEPSHESTRKSPSRRTEFRTSHGKN